MRFYMHVIPYPQLRALFSERESTYCRRSDGELAVGWSESHEQSEFPICLNCIFVCGTIQLQLLGGTRCGASSALLRLRPGFAYIYIASKLLYSYVARFNFNCSVVPAPFSRLCLVHLGSNKQGGRRPASRLRNEKKCSPAGFQLEKLKSS